MLAHNKQIADWLAAINKVYATGLETGAYQLPSAAKWREKPREPEPG